MTETIEQPSTSLVEENDHAEADNNQLRKPFVGRLGVRLIEKGMITSDQLEVVLREQRANPTAKKMLGDLLISMGFITESDLAEALTESSGIKNIDLQAAVLDPDLINLVPKEVAVRYKVIPVVQTEDSVSIAMTDVYNIMAIDQVKRYFPKHVKIIPFYAAETDIMGIIDQYYRYEMSINGILREIENNANNAKSADGGGKAQSITDPSLMEEGYVNPTVRLVDALLLDAIKVGASDIHFEPESTVLRLRYRIDGKMTQIRSFHKEYLQAILVRIKIISGMNITETRNPQDGRISYNVFGRVVDFRVATQPTIHGENIVMRILDKKASIVPLSNLGFSESNSKLLKKLLKRPEGIVIVTGPTGSGKSTTLYSILNFINSIDKNIMTLEDPVEYQLPLIRQANVREGSGMNFTDGIKSLMRQDPDIIFIGEVRDAATATMALRAAMTGHQVFTTLHTNDAIGAIPRLTDIGVSPQLISGSVICIMAQRLARKLCPDCKRGEPANAEECRIMGISSEDPPIIYHRIGCDKCKNTGTKGRIGISEILPIDRGLDELIAKEVTRQVMVDYALDHGLIPMVEDGIGKVLQGVIDLEELIGTIDMTSRL